MGDNKFKPLKYHKNFKEAQKQILEERKKNLSQFLGVSTAEIARNFERDLYGVLSGGGDEREKAREWLLMNYKSVDRTRDNLSYGEIKSHLNSFYEKSILEVNELAEEIEEKKKRKIKRHEQIK